MNKKRSGLIALMVLLFSMNAFAQQITDLKLNEMLINNQDNYIDEYGRHVPWIEIFNTAYNSVDVAECYLTNDTTGLADGSGLKNWYRIPKGDPKTLLKQRGFVVFYMDNAPLYGTFHVNFDPREEGASNYVALISSNGRTLIDIFEFPDELRESSEHSYGYKSDGIAEVEENGSMVSNKGFLEYFTPGSTNKVFEGLTKSEKVALEDPYGIGLAVISMIVVFSVLIIIYLMLKVFARLNRAKTTKPVQTDEKMQSAAAPAIKSAKEDFTGEELAAITMALHLHLSGQHDEESEIITIETPSAHYSPWSQKELTFRRNPSRR
ncbi:OadG family protein [Bacteroidales bacterium OttesenSCG-928-B11]|nr:OadG family protein [Bacteroidales bacterium OttesenSCG-928-B11]